MLQCITPRAQAAGSTSEREKRQRPENFLSTRIATPWRQITISQLHFGRSMGGCGSAVL